MFTRARGVDVSFREVKIKIPDRGMWMTSCTGSARTRHRTRRIDFSGLAEARLICALRVPHEMGSGADGKARIERMCISLLMSKNLQKLNGNKSFRVSGFLCSMYICYERSMYVSHICIVGMVHCYLAIIILFRTIYSFAHNQMVQSIAM